MERYDVSEGARLAEMVEAAGHSGTVEITRAGAVVARIVRSAPVPKGIGPGRRSKAYDSELLSKVHAITAPLGIKDAARLVREMRDED